MLGEPLALDSHGIRPSLARRAAGGRATTTAAAEHRHAPVSKDTLDVCMRIRTRVRAPEPVEWLLCRTLKPSLTLIALPGHSARCNTVEHMSLSTYYITAACAHVVLLSFVGPDHPVRPWALPTSTAHFGARLHHLASNALSKPFTTNALAPSRTRPGEPWRFGHPGNQSQTTSADGDAGLGFARSVPARRQLTRVAVIGMRSSHP